MIRSLNSCHVGTEPWAPEVFVEKPKPMEPQVAHPYMLLLLKGGQTRFYRSKEEFEEADRSLGKKSRLGFQYLESCHEYATVSEDGFAFMVATLDGQGPQ